MAGQTVCMVHGGKAGRAKARAVERVAQAEIVEAVQVFGVPVPIDPATGLIQEYWRSHGIVKALERLVSAIRAEDLTFGVVEVTETEGARDWPTDKGDDDRMTIELGGVSIDLSSKSLIPSERKTVKRAGVVTVVKMFNEERDRFAKLGEIITRLGLEAQRDAYVRDQAVLLADVLGQLNLTKDQRRKAAELLRGMGTT